MFYRFNDPKVLTGNLLDLKMPVSLIDDTLVQKNKSNKDTNTKTTGALSPKHTMLYMQNMCPY